MQGERRDKHALSMPSRRQQSHYNFEIVLQIYKIKRRFANFLGKRRLFGIQIVTDPSKKPFFAHYAIKNGQ